jgi:hypothetical protein
VLAQLTAAANASVAIDEALSVSLKPDPNQNSFVYSPYAQTNGAQSPTAAAQNLVASRAQQFKRRMESGKYALVIAEQDAPAPGTTLKNAESPIERHVRVIRALVPLRSE